MNSLLMSTGSRLLAPLPAKLSRLLVMRSHQHRVHAGGLRPGEREAARAHGA